MNGWPKVVLTVRYRNQNAFFAEGANILNFEQLEVPGLVLDREGQEYLFHVEVPGYSQVLQLKAKIAQNGLSTSNAVLQFFFDDERERQVFRDEVKQRMVGALGEQAAAGFLDDATTDVMGVET